VLIFQVIDYQFLKLLSGHDMARTRKVPNEVFHHKNMLQYVPITRNSGGEWNGWEEVGGWEETTCK
jgi:predicted small integral membrane protein